MSDRNSAMYSLNDEYDLGKPLGNHPETMLDQLLIRILQRIAPPPVMLNIEGIAPPPLRWHVVLEAGAGWGCRLRWQSRWLRDTLLWGT